MGEVVKQTDLFNIHPMAWTHAQAILNQEIEMLKQGASKDQRIEYLREESSRLIRQSEITLVDSMNAVFTELSRSDVVHGIDEMSKRFLSYGFSGTLRSMRNHHRTMGLQNSGLDAVSVQCAIAVLENDTRFIDTLKHIFMPALENIIDSKEMVSIRNDLMEIYEQHILQSEKERQAITIVIDALQRTEFEKLNFGDINVRDLAYLRSRILDVDISDILITLVSTVGSSSLSKFLLITRETQVEIYANVLTALINNRLIELQSVPMSSLPPTSTSTPLPSSDGSHAASDKGSIKHADIPDLMTLSEVMAYLQVSRTTLFQLRKTGALDVRHVGSSVRVTRESVMKYLDLQ